MQITVLRDGRRQNLSVCIGTLTKDKLASMGSTRGAEALGLTVQTLTPQLAEQFDAKRGDRVVITSDDAGSIAALAGIEPGAVILQVNREPVSDAAAFKRAIERSRAKRVLLLIRKDGMQQFLVLNW